ncbi:MAG: glycosyltransferase [Bacteroidales bacterium]|nr:glycosyltransferase [Bacteroidales bacterium]
MNNPAKIVLIGPAHPLRGGLATFNERLIREYRMRGDDAMIYTFSLQYPSVLFPGKTQFSSEPAPPDLPIHIKVNSINPFNWIKTGLELRKLKPDLVIVKFWIPFMAPCFGTICRIIKGNKHSRIITIIDNIIPHEHRPGDRALAAFWIGSVDGCVAMSRSVLNDLNKFDAVKPKLYCPHPLYDNFGDPVSKREALERLQLDPGFRYVLFFGFIRDYKGLDLLLEAFADEHLSQMNVRLLVAGEFYCDPKPYHEIIARHHLEDKVIMSNDFIPDSQVLNYFCAADLIVQPYKSATQSGVTQIAFHFNKPMVITNVGGLAEFVPHEKAGYVVNPDPAEIAASIVRFYSENRESEFSANAALEKQKYSWGNMVETIDKLTVTGQSDLANPN